jgi:hypothetical protein
MDLLQKFQVVATLKCVAPPTLVELDKPYPIVRTIRIMWSIIILLLSADDAEKLASCVLSPSYSRIFNENDISKLNAEGKFQFIHKKKAVDPIDTYWTLYSSSAVQQ